MVTRQRRLVALIAAVAVVAVGGLWTWQTYKYDLFPKRFGVVVEGLLYRSGQLSPVQVRRQIREHDIQVVIALNGDENNPGSVAERQVAQELGLQRLVLPLEGDGTGDIRHYADAVAAMVAARDARRPALVHCAAGSYRTGGVVAAYRLLVERDPPADVWREMQQYDWNDRKPQLPQYLNEHMAELARLLVERGVIDRVPDPLPVLAPPDGG